MRFYFKAAKTVHAQFYGVTEVIYMKKSYKLGIALGSGGARGVAHIGVLKALDEAGIKPDFITGCSMGSVVGAAYAAGLEPETICDIILKLKPAELMEPTIKKGGLFSSSRIAKVIERHIGNPDFKDLKIPFRCVAVDLYSQTEKCFSEGKVIDAVVASSCMPTIFTPTENDGKLYIDGGILDRVPVEPLIGMGAEKIVAVDVLGKQTMVNDLSTINVLLQIIGIMDYRITKFRQEKLKDKIDIWIEPDLGDMTQYAFKNFDFAYRQGYAAGKNLVQQIKKL